MELDWNQNMRRREVEALERTAQHTGQIAVYLDRIWAELKELNTNS